MPTGKAVKKTTVYYGPGSSLYPSENSWVGPNETVTILWQEDGWYYIEYFVGNTGIRKRMYIPISALSAVDGGAMVKNLLGTARLSKPAVTYAGPGPGYAPAGSVGTESVTAYDHESGGYTLVEYSISGNQRKRAFIDSSKISSSGLMDSLLGLIPANLNHEAYYGPGNIYTQGGYRGQCTWYCWGRAYEKCGKKLSFSGPNNGGQWYANVIAGNVTKRAASMEPVKNSIASFSGGSTGKGHLIFIEEVADGFTYFTEFNFNQGQNARMQKVPTTSFATFRANFRLNGYIVL